LEGSQTVEGCCPNAGPFPAYNELTLSGSLPGGTYDGNIFMNGFGRRAEWDYKFQFWWGEEPDNCYFIEIRGGESNYDKRTKILTVTFADEAMTIIHPAGDSTYVNVSFILTRAPQ
jgi:hypothetical protein